MTVPPDLSVNRDTSDDEVAGELADEIAADLFEEDAEEDVAGAATAGAADGVTPGDWVAGKRVALVGRFGGMNQREATNVLRSYDAIVVDVDHELVDWVVVGAEESPLAEAELLRDSVREAAAAGQVEILHETDLWHRLGLVDVEQAIRRYYTPAMLAHLLGVSVRVIRRWQRRGLITPVQTLHRLPYFDFQEVATARRLAQWIASGASPQAIEQRLVEWVEVLPDIQRPLDQLSILIEGKHVLMRQGEGLLEPGGQLRFDFDAFDSGMLDAGASEPVDDLTFPPATLAIFSDIDKVPDEYSLRHSSDAQSDALLSAAFVAEDDGDFATAIDYCHAIIARDGPRADISFQIGEMLYRLGEPVAARERYYSAIEVDPDFVEARASLGSVLSETGQLELAVAAFRGALSLHSDYADVHYNLARVLDQLERSVESKHHWKRFLDLAPDSPWAGEAISRIAEIDE
ncbi:helix-turn-helix domain-containing protein [Rubripirellula reticaptiva]|uniref:Tetratricopeptide repeat protein n=1 Tax=Rubripirellula reticaptiva TaxID=2528013 RepID=A0A5C6EH52_9BACT|nr:helix-turn-helix domain-containing protein [Rubripirellula reticaptiva]TWU47870.1 Tetratricopeptide repeat protein [Rubripirellula reticaptiva]